MAHPIPVQTTVTPGYAPLDQLALDLMAVTQDGTIAKEYGSFPVTAGVAEVPDIPLPDPQLRWAIRIMDVAGGGPVYRSGPLGRLPGASHLPLADHIRLHRGGGGLSLDEGDGIPEALIDYVRDHLAPQWTFGGLDLAADAAGRYQLTFHGRWRMLPFADLAVAYRRSFGIAPGVDAGRPRRIAVAYPQGPWDAPPLPVREIFRQLDVVLAAGVEAQMTAMGTHIGWLMVLAAGITDLTPQTVSMTSIALHQYQSGLFAQVVLTAGALAGGVRVFDPGPVVVFGS